MKPLVIYHANCWDGFCAAWIARKALHDIEAIPAQYGQPGPSVAEREVYILDFSYPRPVLAGMAKEAAQIVVIDHHKTAEASLKGLDEELAPYLTAVFDMNKSGGRLTWEWFTAMGYDLPTPNAPRSPWLVDYTEDRDLCRHTLEGTQEINAALRSYPLDFDLWDQFEQKDPRSTFYYDGAAIRRAERQIVESHVRNARRENFDGTWTVPIVNATTLFSEIAGELAKGEPFAATYFDRQDGKRQWSLRSDENGLDVSEIAKAHGGGGHAHAAGFEQVI